jgi:sarcosine oxidase delta subunit
MNITSRILGEAMRKVAKRKVRPPTKKELTTAHWAFNYARYNIKGRFPEGEAAIATDPYVAYVYARDVLKGRFPEAEASIATHPYCANQYLIEFPQAKLEWAMNGWIDWLDL